MRIGLPRVCYTYKGQIVTLNELHREALALADIPMSFLP